MKKITRYFSLVVMAFCLLLPAQASSMLVTGLGTTAVSEEALVSVSPNPADGPLEAAPEQVVMTFNQQISAASMPALVVGMGDFIDLDPAAVKVEGQVVTVTIPVEKLVGLDYFGLSLRVDDVNGEAITVGDMMGFVTINYDLLGSPNTYQCTQITPAVGEVKELREFVLKFVDENAFGGDGVIGGVDSSKEIHVYDEYFTLVATGTISVDYENFASEAKIILDKPILADGHYSMVVPEGTFYNGSFNPDEADFGVANFGAIYNPELTFDYKVQCVPTVEVDPDPAAGKLNSIPSELTFTFAKEVKTVEEAAVNLGSGYSIPVEPAQVSINGKVVKVQLPKAELEGFPGFVFVMVVTDVEGQKITFGGDEGCVKVEYDFFVPANTFNYGVVNPAEGEVEFLEKFTLTFEGKDMVGGFDDNKQIVVMDQFGKEVAKGTPSFSEDWSKALDVEVVLDQKITDAGTYFLVIPEGTVYDGNYNPMEADFGVSEFGATYNPEIRLMFMVAGATEVQNVFRFVSVNPAEGEVAELSKFDITLENPKDQMDFIGGIATSDNVVLKNEAGEVVAKGQVTFDADAWNTVFTVTLDKVVKDKGNYVLTVPAGVVFNSAYAPDVEDHGASWGAICNDEIALHYTVGSVTGIGAVPTSGAAVKVYSLDGVYLGHSVSNLPKGIYIVNGQKVVVK